MKVGEIRHLGGIKGNFGVSDTEYISTSDTISTSDRVTVPEIGGSEIEQKTEAAKNNHRSNPSTCSLQQCERGYPTATTYFRNPMD